MIHDVIIIGGSYAGLSAGLPLARARRQVLVIDGGERRNRFADHSHGFLTNDGRPAAEIAAEGRRQLLAYPTVRWEDARAEHAEAVDGGFRIIANGEERLARRLVLATGVRDELPAIPGLAERWGRAVFHCPYCHGYELNQGRIGVLAVSEHSFHHAMLLPDWGETTFFLNGAFTPNDEEMEKLLRRGVRIEPTAVERMEGHASVVLRDGRTIELDGVFTGSRVTPSTPLGEALGCETTCGPMGCVLKVDTRMATSVPGVFACGDAARMAGSVALAVGDGAMAGAAAHQSLVFA